MNTITPCLWFDTEGEDAANFYTSVFPNSKIVDIARYGEAGPRAAGTVMTVSFELHSDANALNGADHPSSADWRERARFEGTHDEAVDQPFGRDRRPGVQGEEG